jgi:spermidine synthase
MRLKVERILLLSLFALGFTSLFTQIFLLREFVAVLYGNELVMGIVLGNWLVLTGIGAFLGKFVIKIKDRISFILFLQFLLSILPLLTTLKLDLWRAESIPFGSMVSLGTIITTSAKLLAPFCLLNGFLFIAFSSLLQLQNKTPFARSYAIESLGSMIAGILVNFIFLWLFDTWTSLRILLIINLIVFLMLLWTQPGKILRLILTPVVLFFMIVPSFSDLRTYTTNLLFPGQHTVYDRSTPFGRITVTENAGQMNYYENGLLLFSSGNEIFNEESVHFGMVQHPQPESVLLISGGLSGTLEEILKYNPGRIDYLEVNPAVIEAGTRFSKQFTDRRIHVFETDARRFLKITGNRYDVVLINLPEPSTLQINRFYTLEFFRLLKSKLAPGAFLSLGLPSTADYVSSDAAQLNSTIFQTLQKVFSNTVILPGQKNYFIASDAPVQADVAALILRKGIGTKYVNPWYLDDNLLKERSDYIMKNLSSSVGLNRDLHPVAFFLTIKYWTSFFRTNLWILAPVALILLLILAVTLNSITLGLFTGGFTASSAEIMILLIFQSTFGYVFQMLGVVITLFMAGLIAGSWLQPKIRMIPDFKSYLVIQIALAGYCAILPLILFSMNKLQLPDPLSILIISFLTLTVSFLTGMEYAVSTHLGTEKKLSTPARNYSADLLGSACGILLTSVLLLPVLGMFRTTVILVILNLISAVFLTVHRKKIVSL